MARRKKQNEEDSKENIENNDDTFGLPEVEYEPLKRDEDPVKNETSSIPPSIEQQPQTHQTMEREEPTHNEYSNTYYNEEENNSPWPKILGILAIILAIGAAIWYFGFYNPKRMAAEEKERQELLAREEAEKREAERLAEERRLAEQNNAEQPVEEVKEGSVETLTSRTGRYYVIVASGVDGDLITDYANKLAAKGIQARIIPPHGKVKFYRLAIADGDTYTSTQSMADGMKNEYSEAWVVKY